MHARPSFDRGTAQAGLLAVSQTARKGPGYVVTDVWESKEALDQYFQTLGSLIQ